MGDRAAEGAAARGHVFEDFVRQLFRRQGATLLPREPGQSETDLQLEVAEAVDPAVLLPPELAHVGGAAAIGPGRVLGEVKVSSRKLGEALAQLEVRSKEVGRAGILQSRANWACRFSMY